MSFRNRPVLNRKHRPRWREELRTQQLTIAGFALAIALAIGIFGATAWNGFYDGHLRLVATVNGESFDRRALDARILIIGAELRARAAEVNAQLGGARDAVIQQQLQAMSQQLQVLTQTASDSLVGGAFMRSQAPRLGITLSDPEIAAEVTRRDTLAAQVKISLITVDALPPTSTATATPADFARAQRDAQAIVDQLRKGADFATLAKQKSTDATTKASGGVVGWIGDKDAVYGIYFTAAKGAKTGAIIGPVKTDVGYGVIKVTDQLPTRPNKVLTDLLAAESITDAQYRAYVHDDMLTQKFRDYFGAKIVVSPAPQRRVAQITILADTGVPVPKERLRHLLVQPLPGQQDQTKATPAQWAAALVKAQKLRAEAAKPGADWNALAKLSDDPGSRGQGGDLGWYDPATSQFAADFKAAVAKQRLGVVSQPERTQFGYHIIEITERRASAAVEAADLVAQLRKDPAAFATLAKQKSEDPATAQKGGELGWVARYEYDAIRENAIFGLAKVGDISNPVTSSGTIYLFKLLETSDSRPIETARLASIRSGGFDRWFAELKAKSQIWVDPQFSGSTASATPPV